MLEKSALVGGWWCRWVVRRDESCPEFKCRGLNCTLNYEGLNSEDIILMVLRCGDLMCDGFKFYAEVFKG